MLARADRLRAHGLLQREHEPGADRLHDGRRAAFLALLDVGEIAVLGRVDVGDRAAAGHRGDAIVEKLAARHEHARRSRPADELVRRDEDRVLVGERIGLAPLRRLRERPHLDRDVRRRRREIPERQSAVPVQQDRDRADVADDAGDVRRRREGADLQRPIRVGDELRLEAREVDPSVVVLRNHDDIRQRLAPGQLVAVVLVGADEDDRARRDGDRRPQVVAIVEACREPDLEAVDEPVDGAGGARAGEQHHVVGRRAADCLADDPARILPEAAGLQPGARGLGVGVRVEREHRLANEVLDERERAAGGRVIGIRDATQPEGPSHRLVLADDVGADKINQAHGLAHQSSAVTRPSCRARHRAAAVQARNRPPA